MGETSVRKTSTRHIFGQVPAGGFPQRVTILDRFGGSAMSSGSRPRQCGETCSAMRPPWPFHHQRSCQRKRPASRRRRRLFLRLRAHRQNYAERFFFDVIDANESFDPWTKQPRELAAAIKQRRSWSIAALDSAKSFSDTRQPCFRRCWSLRRSLSSKNNES